MSTATKLEYLNTTKGKIKDSINLTGANIGSNDTFRSYATKLRDGLLNVLNNGTIVLYNNFPKVSGTGSNISLTNTLEAPMFMNKFDGDTLQDGEPTPDTPVEIQSVEGIQNITIDDGNGNSQTQEVNLGDIKLYNGDYITGTPDNWSVVKNDGSVVLNGSENIENWTSGTNTIGFKLTNVSNLKNIESSSTENIIISNYFTKSASQNALTSNDVEGFATTGGNLYFKINKTTANSLASFKTWLSTHNTIVDYVLATETTTPITDTTLISQLNNVYKLKSYDDTTNISVEGNLPMILEASALKDEI